MSDKTQVKAFQILLVNLLVEGNYLISLPILGLIVSLTYQLDPNDSLKFKNAIKRLNFYDVGFCFGLFLGRFHSIELRFSHLELCQFWASLSMYIDDIK